MAIFLSAARAAIVRMTCPKCGEVQARARGAKGTKYTCVKCKKTFSDTDGKTGKQSASRRRK